MAAMPKIKAAAKAAAFCFLHVPDKKTARFQNLQNHYLSEGGLRPTL